MAIVSVVVDSDVHPSPKVSGRTWLPPGSAAGEGLPALRGCNRLLLTPPDSRILSLRFWASQKRQEQGPTGRAWPGTALFYFVLASQQLIKVNSKLPFTAEELRLRKVQQWPQTIPLQLELSESKPV